MFSKHLQQSGKHAAIGYRIVQLCFDQEGELMFGGYGTWLAKWECEKQNRDVICRFEKDNRTGSPTARYYCRQLEWYRVQTEERPIARRTRAQM